MTKSARGESPAAFDQPCILPDLRCSSVAYTQYAPSSRLARQAPDRSRCDAGFHHGLISPRTIACILTFCGASLLAHGQEPPVSQAPSPRQQSQVDLIIGNRIGAQPTYAVPDCLARGGDESLAEAGRTIAEVLWADLEFEREFRMMARDTYDSIPRARSLEAIPFDRWIELGVDGVVSCRVESAGGGRLQVTARLFNTRSRTSAFGVEYSGSADNVRLYAHQLADEIHRQQRGLDGVARTRIAFVSDRDSESVLGLVENRQTKEVYFADYDGVNNRRVTVSRSLNTNP